MKVKETKEYIFHRNTEKNSGCDYCKVPAASCHYKFHDFCKKGERGYFVIGFVGYSTEMTVAEMDELEVENESV